MQSLLGEDQCKLFTAGLTLMMLLHPLLVSSPLLLEGFLPRTHTRSLRIDFLHQTRGKEVLQLSHEA